MVGRSLYVRSDAPLAAHSLRVTLPKKWVERETCSKVVRLFVESYNARHPPVAAEGCALWGDRSQRKFRGDEGLAGVDEETVWVREGSGKPEAAAASRAVSTYVPRIVAKREARRPELATMRLENQQKLVERAGAILAIFGVRSDDGAVLAARRVTRDSGEEQLVAQLAAHRYEMRRAPGKAGGYADALCRVWNVLSGLLPASILVVRYLPLRRENGKVVGEAPGGDKWIARPFVDGDPCFDPARLGEALGWLHVLGRGVPSQAAALAEIRPKSYAERLASEVDKCREKLRRRSGSERRRVEALNFLDTLDVAAISALPETWTHGSLSPATCRVGNDGRLVVDGLENSGLGTRIEDLWPLVKWDGTAKGLVVGLAALPVALRAYVKTTRAPFSPQECRLLPWVLWLRAAIDVSVGLKTLSRLAAAAQDVATAAADANPKLLEDEPPTPLLLLPPPDDQEEEEEEEEEEEPAEDGFWAAWATKVKSRRRRPRPRATTRGEFEDIFAKFNAAPVDDKGTIGVVEAVEVSRAVGVETRTRPPGRAVCCALHLERDARRAAHVQEHIRKVVPGIRVVRAVDAMIDGELEASSSRLRVDVGRWRLGRVARDGRDVGPTRGEVACAATHCAAWRLQVAAAEPRLVVLEDDVQLASNFLPSLVLALAEVDDVDLVYLHVPPRFRRDDLKVSQRLSNVYPAASLAAYVLSLEGATKLIDLVDALDAPLDLLVNRLALDQKITAFAVLDANLVRSRGDPALHRLRLLPSTISTTPPWREPFVDAPNHLLAAGDDDDDTSILL
ncbi:hypothetical protein CTAYLR_008552 [Chrysophaeum taylorii]|uniref:Glycosyl transferase family 25 domain-containing protein n=1 Tax=Chrysophaeum taylorii TaxID=2483200 RepID=A0AAD7XH53_9STRA|nr:hypothetical protein CTAYLR_008552 [Chrysophaeum taylorii]